MALRPEEIEYLVERKLRFQYVTHNFPAGVQQTIPHNLNRIPLRWSVAKKDAPATVYGTDDQRNFYLTATVSATVTLEFI